MAARILVVNNTPDMLDLFRDILEYEGYEVVLSSLPFKSMYEIEKIQPDLVILDFIFGGEHTGWQMLQLLKKQPSMASIPVIVCTEVIYEIQRQEGSFVSQDIHVVYKPFDIDHLLATVKQALATHKKGRSQTEEL